MKINVSEQELDGLRSASLRGAAEGILGGLALSLPASLYAHRRWAAYRTLPPSLKAFAIVLVVAPACVIQTERRNLEYDESHWKGASIDLLEKVKAKKESEWDTMGTKDKLRRWANQNQYKIILGSWAASIAIAGAIIMRDRHQSTSQKVVQARMWAQGLTIGILVAAGIMTHSQREEAAKHPPIDHSWRELLEVEAQEEARRRVRTLTPSQPSA